MSSTLPNSSFLGDLVYKLTSPTFETDATGGTISVVNNVKFNTNVPLDRCIAITEVDWIVTTLDNQGAPTASAGNGWLYIGQLTEALARTTPALGDNVDIDVYEDEVYLIERQDTAVGDATYFMNRQKVMERHVLRHPWLTVAQQLNLVGQAAPTENSTQPGPEIQWAVRIFFQLLPLTQELRSYLATRIQIAGQA